jgi:hypothetical protein
MSDTDYINDHMGGFDSDGLPNFLSYGSGKGGMDGYGDVDYAFYHSDERGLGNILYAITMTLEAVKLLPYTINDKTHWKEKSERRYQHPELVGIADGWSDIYDVFRIARDKLLAGTRYNLSKDYFIFIHPEKGILEVTFIGKQESRDESTSVELYMEPDPLVDADKWRFGLISALQAFDDTLKKGYYNGSLSRLTKDQFDAYLTHKIAIRDIRLELEYLNELDDDSDINNKLIKDKIIELVTEMERFGSPTYKRAKMDEIKILVEIPTKDDLMPIFEIIPSECGVYNLYEMSPKGDVVSLHWMPNETLKEKYSLVNGAYSVPLLDLIKARKLSHFEHLYK